MSLKPKRIMVVEDELLVAEDIAECLSLRGFEVVGIAKSSDEALTIAREHRPDLALMDIVIQGERDGIDTAAILRSELQIPVIFLTAYSQNGIIERAKAVEPLGYIIKPFEEGNLISTVEIALHKSRLDAALRKSEEWFSTTLNSIGDGVIATDEHARVKYLNQLAEILTGWSTEEASGRRIEEIFPIVNESTGAAVPNPAAEALESGQIRELANHTMLICRDGSQIAIDDSGAPIRSPEGKIVGAVLIFRDVTEKKNRDKEIFRYQQHLEDLVQERTAALTRRVELEREAIDISADLIRLNEETYDQGLNDALARIGRVLGLDGCGIYEEVRNDGMQKSLPVCLWTSSPEMLERVAGEEPVEGDFPYWTDQLATEGQVIVRSMADLPACAAAEQALMTRMHLQSLVVLPLGPVQTLRWTISYSSHQPQSWCEEDIILFRMFGNVLKSVLERREFGANQRRLQEQLNQAQKLEAIGKLTGGIAHDFNNMLVPIIGYADSILSNSDPNQCLNDIVEIRKAAESAAALTRQLLAFSRKQILDKKPLCLNQLIRDKEGFLKRLLGEDIRFQIELAPELAPVEADHGQLEQVLMNLCVNARDAMPSGGLLRIRTRQGTDAQGLPTTMIEVVDSGCGIEKELLDKIFDPFFTTKGMHGTGLGLSVVLGVMDQHGGWAKAASELNRGTMFTVGLPSTANKPPAASEGNGSARIDTCGSGQRILLVEDEPAVLQFVSSALTKRGYEIVRANSKSVAIHAFDKGDQRFDLIFTDAKLPDGNGIEVLEHVFRHNPNMPALVSSGYTDDRALVEQAKRRGVEFLQKPYPLDLLYQTVHRILQQGSREIEDDVALNA